MLALICGTGALPAKVARAQDTAPLVCVLEGFAPDDLTPDLTFRIETLGGLLIALGQQGVTDVCFCGAITRPALDPGKLDEHTKPLIPLIMDALNTGDDGALRAIISIFEQTGFTVRGAHELAPDLVAQPGVLSEAWPDAKMRKDAKLGADILAALAPMDVGQACVTSHGQLLGMETLGGTDHLLATLPDTPLLKDAILVKGPKQGQDTRADMPTIGPKTIEAAKRAGLRGIIVDAGDVLILEQERCVALADAAGLVLWSRTGD